MRKFVNGFVISSFILAGCASSPDEISGKYVSPLQYQQYNCNQIRMEMMRVSRKVNEVAGHQQGEADGDAAALGVGLVLFWPALFFMIGDDKEEELSQLKGEYEALERAAIEKECNVTDEIEEARKLKQERQEEREKLQDETGQLNE